MADQSFDELFQVMENFDPIIKMLSGLRQMLLNDGYTDEQARALVVVFMQASVQQLHGDSEEQS